MPSTLPAHHRTVIAAFKHETALYVLAASPAMQSTADAIVRRIPKPRVPKTGGAYGRYAIRVPGDDPAGFLPQPKSWCLAVLIDTATPWPPLLQMGRRLGVDGQARTLFHLDARVDPVRTLDPWTVLTSTPDYAVYTDPNNLLKHVLERLNNQSLRDHAPGAAPGIP